MTWEETVKTIDRYVSYEEMADRGVSLPHIAGGTGVEFVMGASLLFGIYSQQQAQRDARRADSRNMERYEAERARQEQMDRLAMEQMASERDMSKRQWRMAMEDRAAGQARQAEADAYRQRILRNIDAPPEDRTRAINEYSDSLAGGMGRIAGEKYNQTVRAAEESMAARGLAGSRAYVDSMAELTKDKERMDTEIGERAVLAREDLMDRDRRYWMDLAGALDSGASRQSVQAMESARLAQGPLAGVNQGLGAMYGGGMSASLANWDDKMLRYRSDARGQIGNTLSGLAYLYGMNSKSPKAANSSLYTKTGTNTYSTPGGYLVNF